MENLSPVQRRLVNAYATLILAERITYEEIREELREYVEIRVAEIEVEKLT